MTDTAAAAEAARLGPALMARLDELGRISDEEGRLTRLYLTPAHGRAAALVAGWMREAGMEARLDAIGNVAGRYEGERPGLPALVLGSHIDTVRDAGRYDGALGVLAAVAAVGELHRAGERLPFAVEVLAFGDEEGVRFPTTLAGSRAVAGTLDAAAVLGVVGEDGVGLREALERFGCDPSAIPGVARRPGEVVAYVEAHIEQGPVLEAEGLPLGVVTAISGASRHVVEVAGVAGHAGTVPMALRRDAAMAAAEMMLAVERTALETPGLVATVGRVEAAPGAVNVIPSGAKFTLDVRSADDAVRRGAVARLRASFDEAAARRGVGVEVRTTYDEPAVACAPWLVGRLGEAVGRARVRPRLLPSGAGHDGLAMAALCPIGMLFVRCAGGVSHNPAEAIEAADAGLCVAVLVDFLRRFVPPSGP
jgi:allantoate deiminase